MRLGIGWNHADRWENREAWGLAPELNGNGNPKKVMLPAGLVIPTRRKSGITAVKVRRASWTSEDHLPKYMALPGSVPGMALGRGKGLPVVIVESEIDAVLVWQEAGDLVNVLALGTASGKPDIDAAGLLHAASHILVSLDCDQAGEEGARWWPKHFANTARWPVVRGKDVGDMVGESGLVRAWIKACTVQRLP
ncbi:hypothetical protein [Humidesulfovibrio idahonensis]